ncbi:MAG: PGPGW domain-containing protein [Actinomycetota bacterium]
MGLAILFFPLPVLPTVLLIAGLLILSTNHAWASTVLGMIRARFPSPSQRKAGSMATAKPA